MRAPKGVEHLGWHLIEPVGREDDHGVDPACSLQTERRMDPQAAVGRHGSTARAADGEPVPGDAEVRQIVVAEDVAGHAELEHPDPVVDDDRHVRRRTRQRPAGGPARPAAPPVGYRVGTELTELTDLTELTELAEKSRMGSIMPLSVPAGAAHHGGMTTPQASRTTPPDQSGEQQEPVELPEGILTIERFVRRNDRGLRRPFAALFGPVLDRRLAAGVAPESGGLLAARAERLVLAPARRKLVREWEGVLEHARTAPRAAARTPLCAVTASPPPRATPAPCSAHSRARSRSRPGAWPWPAGYSAMARVRCTTETVPCHCPPRCAR